MKSQPNANQILICQIVCDPMPGIASTASTHDRQIYCRITAAKSRILRKTQQNSAENWERTERWELSLSTNEKN